MHFGKHKGKTVEEVHKEDKGYLVWLISNKDFNWVGLNNERLKLEIEKKLKLI
jgi:hypothetical protein